MTCNADLVTYILANGECEGDVLIFTLLLTYIYMYNEGFTSTGVTRGWTKNKFSIRRFATLHSNIL